MNLYNFCVLSILVEVLVSSFFDLFALVFMKYTFHSEMSEEYSMLYFMIHMLKD